MNDLLFHLFFLLASLVDLSNTATKLSWAEVQTVDRGTEKHQTNFYSLCAQDTVCAGVKESWPGMYFFLLKGWYDCPDQWLFAGFFHANVEIFRLGIDKMKCVKPEVNGALTQTCYDEDITIKFDSQGTVECRPGYFVRGFLISSDYPLTLKWTDDNTDGGLHEIEKLKCCKYNDADIITDSVSERHDWWNCFDSGNRNKWCQVEEDEYVTGLYRTGDISNGNDISHLEESLVKHIYRKDDTLLNCRIENYDIDDNGALNKLTGRSFPNTGVNTASVERVLAEIHTSKEVTKSTTFTYESGTALKAGYELKVTSGFKIGFGSESASSITGERSLTSKYDRELTESDSKTMTTETKTRRDTKTVFSCPPESICQRNFIVLETSADIFPITVTYKCEQENKFVTRITNGYISVKGGQQIQVIDTIRPLNCAFYTNDYYDRNNGKLAYCDTCANNANVTNYCDICRDGYVLLDGQCITDSICEADCGGEIAGPGAEGKDDPTPWRGGYCKIINLAVYNSKQCQKKSFRSKYNLVLQPKSWEDAEKYCQFEFGTNLATAISESDMQELLKMSANHDGDEIWIGLNDNKNEGEWGWSSGYSCNYAPGQLCKNDIHFRDGEPNDVNKEEDCGSLIRGAFNDLKCENEHPFFCDKNKVTSSPIIRRLLSN